MAEGNGAKFLGGGLGQVLITVLSALVMTLLAWAWNLTQDVRALMESQPKLTQIEEILERARERGRAELGLLANRLTKLEQVDAGRERELSGIHTALHDLSEALLDVRTEVGSQRATLRHLEGRNGKPPVER